MKDFPKLHTERLVLDQPKWTDIPDIVSYAGDFKITEFTRSMPHPYHDEDAICWINMVNQGFKNNDNYIFAIREKTEEAFMGGIGLTIDLSNNRAELGYWLAVPFWNKGYITESINAILKFGFEKLHLNKIIAVYIPENVASGLVMEKNGMVKEAELKDHDRRGDGYTSLIQYRMTKSEYEALPK